MINAEDAEEQRIAEVDSRRNGRGANVWRRIMNVNGMSSRTRHNPSFQVLCCSGRLEGELTDAETSATSAPLRPLR